MDKNVPLTKGKDTQTVESQTSLQLLKQVRSTQKKASIENLDSANITPQETNKENESTERNVKDKSHSSKKSQNVVAEEKEKNASENRLTPQESDQSSNTLNLKCEPEQGNLKSNDEGIQTDAVPYPYRYSTKLGSTQLELCNLSQSSLSEMELDCQSQKPESTTKKIQELEQDKCVCDPECSAESISKPQIDPIRSNRQLRGVQTEICLCNYSSSSDYSLANSKN